MCLNSAVLSKFSNKFHRVQNLETDGIQEVSGSIPLISTNKRHTVSCVFCFFRIHYINNIPAAHSGGGDARFQQSGCWMRSLTVWASSGLTSSRTSSSPRSMAKPRPRLVVKGPSVTTPSMVQVPQGTLSRQVG